MIRSDQSPRSIKHLSLPSLTGSPGPLHTLVEDTQGNIYYSDEINHSLVSLDGRAELRWHFSAKGTEPCQFHYPQGMALGWMRQDGNQVRCLAVCDSWNRRIQFFSLDGHYLSAWSQGGATPFSEVADVRYVPAIEHEKAVHVPCGFWLVLDRGNHRLCAFGQSGQPLFEIGRPFSPGLTERWVTTAALPQKDLIEPRTVLEHPPIDFLHYPTRIFGFSEDTLCLWEPMTRKLKLVIGGNLFPVSLPELAHWECVAVDRTGMILWLKSDSLLRLYDREATQQWEGGLKGVPVLSNSPSTRLWVQDGLEIRCWDWLGGDLEINHKSRLAVALLRRSAARELELLAGEEITEAVHKILENTSAFLEFADSAVAAATEKPWSDRQTVSAAERLAELKQEASPLLEGFSRLLHHLNLGIAELRWACAAEPASTALPDLEQTKQHWWGISEPLRDACGELVQRADDVFVLFEGFLKAEESRPDPFGAQRYFFAQMETECRARIAWIRDWCGPRKGAECCLRLPDPITDPRDALDSSLNFGHLLRRAAPHPCAPASRFLKEVDRILLNDFTDVSPARPAHLASDTKGDIFVSVFAAHRVLWLDPTGRFRGSLGNSGKAPGALQNPTGVACDARGRLWVADAGNRRIQIFNLAGNGSSTPDVLGENHDFGWPGGLCAFGSDSILVADTLRYRVYRIYLDGTCEVLCNRQGAGPGEIRHPNSFCRDVTDPQGSVWLVDQKNNRLQKIDPSGRFSGQLGRRGLGEGCLLSPRSAAMFPDGALVVAQEWFPELKLFSGGGTEMDQLPLDYSPGGMMVHQGRLLVSQSDGDSIRIYERT